MNFSIRGGAGAGARRKSRDELKMKDANIRGGAGAGARRNLEMNLQI